MKEILLRKKLIMTCIGLLIYITFMEPQRCHGYIMPAEQIIDLMSRNFSALKTVIIRQSTSYAGQDGESVFEEQVSIKSPDIYYTEMVNQSLERAESPDMSYRQLLISNTISRLEQLLIKMGINIETVAFTRIDGIVAYMIGEKGPDSPKLIVEKERFLPLYIIYRLREGASEEIITVGYRDYRKLDKGWYPFEIHYSIGDRIKETYTIISIQPNEPVNESLLQPFEVKPSKDQVPEPEISETDEERIRKIIKAFEDKYR